MSLCACGQQVAAGDSFCAGCGRPLLAAPAAPPAVAVPAGFQWKWALLTIPIVVVVTLVLMVAAGVLMVAMGAQPDDKPRQALMGVMIILLSMLLGGVLAGWLSPGRTIYEPGVGIAAALTGLNLATGTTDGLLVGWILPFLIGAAGAWIGERLPKKSTTAR
jgi:hypothetical protein